MNACVHTFCTVCLGAYIICSSLLFDPLQWNFLPCDEGEGDITSNPSWQPDEGWCNVFFGGVGEEGV